MRAISRSAFTAVVLLGLLATIVPQSPVLALLQFETGRTYYVAPNGNDSNPGSESQPWRTIQHAANTLQAGETVLVKEGTYSEYVRPANSGTPGEYIVFKAYPGHRPAVTYSGGDKVFDIDNVGYIEVNGFEVWSEHWNATGIKTTNAHHIRVLNNILRDCGLSGFATYLGCDYLHVEGNVVYGNSHT
jgi:hypothetical protein